MAVVEVLESCMVAPGEATPKHRMWLPIWDLVQARTHTPLVYLYRPSPGRSAFFSPDILKAALSKALVPFYPLAGRLGSDSAGRPEIRCTGDGVLFVTARVDATLYQLQHLAPSEELRRMIVPIAEDGDHAAGVLAMFQVTFLQCGGVCLGTSIHHTVSDGHSFGNFLKLWAAITRGDGEAARLLQPCLDRNLLRALNPPPSSSPVVRFHQHPAEYPQRGSVPSKPRVPFRTAILPISKDQVDALKATAGSAEVGKKVSTFSAVVAHVWRCACKAKGLTETEDTRVYVGANARPRIHPPLPAGYLGNAIVRTSTPLTKVNDIVSSPLGAVADKVSAAVSRLSDQYIRSLGDYLEHAMSDGPGLHHGRAVPDNDLRVVSWIRVPLYDMDYGWGRPSFMSRAFFDNNNLVYLVSSPDGEGPLNVTISMEPEALSRFKELFYEGLKHYSMVSEIHTAPDARAIKHSKL